MIENLLGEKEKLLRIAEELVQTVRPVAIAYNLESTEKRIAEIEIELSKIPQKDSPWMEDWRFLTHAQNVEQNGSLIVPKGLDVWPIFAGQNNGIYRTIKVFREQKDAKN